MAMAGFVTRRPPEFVSLEEERLHRKQRLAAHNQYHAELEDNVCPDRQHHGDRYLVSLDSADAEEPQARQRDCIHVGESGNQRHRIQPGRSSQARKPGGKQQHHCVDCAKGQRGAQLGRIPDIRDRPRTVPLLTCIQIGQARQAEQQTAAEERQ